MAEVAEAPEAAGPATEAIAPEPAPAPASIEEYLEPQPPYPEERVAALKKFFKKRETKPDLYRFTAEGDLEVLGKEGDVKEGIALKAFVPYDPAAWAARDETRLEVIALAEQRYEEALTAVRAAMAEFAATGARQPVVAAQTAAAEADAVLSRVRYGARGLQALANPEVREVLFDQPYETRKLISGLAPDPFDKELVRMITREFPIESFWGTYVDSVPREPTGAAGDAFDEAPGGDETAVRQRMRDGRYARVFLDADATGANGFLSPFWKAEFTLGDTQYINALQAYEAERAKEIGQDALRTRILGTQAPRMIRFYMKKVAAQPKDPRGLWLRVLTALYQQHPELKERLLATGTDALVFADIFPGPSGVGLAPREAGILDPSRWKGPNAMGVALETLRIQMREGVAGEAPVNAAPTERAITEDEMAAARTGAIIAQKKKFSFKKPGV
jgi:predicted NAD-dependent protein-ADP-ribosyltransferase YbiA (DUF1768 family)